MSSGISRSLVSNPSQAPSVARLGVVCHGAGCVRPMAVRLRFPFPQLPQSTALGNSMPSLHTFQFLPVADQHQERPNLQHGKLNETGM